MREREDRNVLNATRRAAGLVARGVLTTPDFASYEFDVFAHAEHVYPEILPELWAAVPEITRRDFATAIRAATLSEFRWYAFAKGGQRRETEEELRREADLNAARIQAWATEFVRFLDGVES